MNARTTTLVLAALFLGAAVLDSTGGRGGGGARGGGGGARGAGMSRSGGSSMRSSPSVSRPSSSRPTSYSHSVPRADFDRPAQADFRRADVTPARDLGTPARSA